MVYIHFVRALLTTQSMRVDACTVNACKARLDKFWQHQLVKFDFTADLTGTGNRSEEVKSLTILMIVRMFLVIAYC